MTRVLRLLAAGILVTASLGNVSFAEDAKSKMLTLVPEIHKAVDADAERVQAIYKDIHEHAELGFMETRTAGIVAEELRALGFEVKTGIGKTGVAGVLQNGDGLVFMFRGDMDGHRNARRELPRREKGQRQDRGFHHPDGPVAEGRRRGLGTQTFRSVPGLHATCAGIFGLGFCQARDIPIEGLGLRMACGKDPAKKLFAHMPFHLIPPTGFPDKYRGSIEKTIGMCTVKRHIVDAALPSFEVAFEN